MRTPPAIVLVGASAGGLEAMSTILGSLTEPLPFALVLVQHRSSSSEALCEVLQRHCSAPLCEVTDKEPIDPGAVYVAPADYHLLVEDGHFALSLDPPEFYSRPSIDLALETAADAYGARAAALVLTGANRDGARGLRRIVERGGLALVQDPASAEVPVMPSAALESVPNAEVVALPQIAARLVRLGAPDARTQGARS